MAKPTKAQKRKKTVQRVIAIVAVVLVAGLAGTLYVRQRVQRSVTAQSGSNVKSVTVTTGSIKATVSGSGSLTSDNVEDLTVPATVKVEKLYVIEELEPFMENEINGIHVEEDIIRQFAGLDRAQGEELGLAISLKMAREALPYADGFYLMTPFNRVALMERLIARLKVEVLE